MLDHPGPERAGDLDRRILEPVSTITISSTAGATAARQRGSISSSSRTIMHRLMVRPVAGRARRATLWARRASAGRRRAAAWCAGRRACAGPPRRGCARDCAERSSRSGRLEQRLGRVQAPELVAGHPGQIEDQRLGRFAFEHGQRGIGQRDEDAGGLASGEVAGGRRARRRSAPVAHGTVAGARAACRPARTARQSRPRRRAAASCVPARRAHRWRARATPTWPPGSGTAGFCRSGEEPWDDHPSRGNPHHRPLGDKG